MIPVLVIRFGFDAFRLTKSPHTFTPAHSRRTHTRRHVHAHTAWGRLFHARVSYIVVNIRSVACALCAGDTEGVATFRKKKRDYFFSGLGCREKWREDGGKYKMPVRTRSQTRPDWTRGLPHELLLIILESEALLPRDVAACAAVCKSWNEALGGPEEPHPGRKRNPFTFIFVSPPYA